MVPAPVSSAGAYTPASNATSDDCGDSMETETSGAATTSSADYYGGSAYGHRKRKYGRKLYVIDEAGYDSFY
jgi:hypothetical protein